VSTETGKADLEFKMWTKFRGREGESKNLLSEAGTPKNIERASESKNSNVLMRKRKQRRKKNRGVCDGRSRSFEVGVGRKWRYLERQARFGCSAGPAVEIRGRNYLCVIGTGRSLTFSREKTKVENNGKVAFICQKNQERSRIRINDSGKSKNPNKEH